MPSIRSIANKVKNFKPGDDLGKSLKGLVSNSLTKLTIESYPDSGYSGTAQSTYEVQFNPNKVEQKYSIEYHTGEASGSKDGQNKFKHVAPSELTLELTIDGTGVNHTKGTGSDFGLTGTLLDVGEEIEKFKKVCCNYDGETHDVPFLKIIWGKSVKFSGRLRDVQINYQLFKSNGDPLRAVLNVTFTSAKNLIQQTKEKSPSSPDLTHIRTVKVGDTLPLMCKAIYNDPSYYIKIARFNNLTDFRNLEPGTEILFPPII